MELINVIFNSENGSLKIWFSNRNMKHFITFDLEWFLKSKHCLKNQVIKELSDIPEFQQLLLEYL